MFCNLRLNQKQEHVRVLTYRSSSERYARTALAASSVSPQAGSDHRSRRCQPPSPGTRKAAGEAVCMTQASRAVAASPLVLSPRDFLSQSERKHQAPAPTGKAVRQIDPNLQATPSALVSPCFIFLFLSASLLRREAPATHLATSHLSIYSCPPPPSSPSTLTASPPKPRTPRGGGQPTPRAPAAIPYPRS